MGEIMEKRNEKLKQNKKESIWRDKSTKHPEGKSSSGMTFRVEKVKSG
jgi:hypothetical protein